LVSLLPSRYHVSFAGGLEPTVMQLMSYFRLALRGACSLLSIVTLSGLTATSEDKGSIKREREREREPDRARTWGGKRGCEAWALMTRHRGGRIAMLGDRGLCGQLAPPFVGVP